MQRTHEHRPAGVEPLGGTLHKVAVGQDPGDHLHLKAPTGVSVPTMAPAAGGVRRRRGWAPHRPRHPQPQHSETWISLRPWVQSGAKTTNGRTVATHPEEKALSRTITPRILVLCHNLQQWGSNKGPWTLMNTQHGPESLDRKGSQRNDRTGAWRTKGGDP